MEKVISVPQIHIVRFTNIVLLLLLSLLANWNKKRISELE